jgi:cellulose synthase/poly-beta-1,6-N-acetylglucosamine synthase-like glycosyltransferase
MSELAAADLVLCCDATNVVAPNFLESSIGWFSDPSVAAVFGRITQPRAQGAVDRWRGRHLFKLDQSGATTRHGVMLSTFGAVIRASAVRAVGGFSAALRHSEDRELGERLSAGGFDTVYDPSLTVVAFKRNSIGEVLERYWRWYAGAGEEVSYKGYWKNSVFALRVMAAADLRERDPVSALISLICPHYQFWRSYLRATRR